MDQIRFAELSGDFNPMHVDAVAARRTGAGAQVVHGVHALLWCLDCVAPVVANASAVAVSSLRVNFDSFITTLDEAAVVLMQSEASRVRVEIQVHGAAALTALLAFGDGLGTHFDKRGDLLEPMHPMDLPPDVMPGLEGRVGFASSVLRIESEFPNAARMLGSRRIAALGAFTRLIGMVCPGLHSIFNRLSLESDNDDEIDEIGFRVTSANLERRRLLFSVGGGGWTGTLTSLIRSPPVPQPTIVELAAHVLGGEFASGVSLIVGGSRGIGEVVAKLIAAGGGEVIITYAQGMRDAELVAEDIRGFGGNCRITKLDVTLPIAPQLAELPKIPNRLFYFATPMIGSRRTKLFDADRFALFLKFYVYGFYDCCAELIDRGASSFTAFYPSSVFVAERTSGVVEYAMAKAAGEELCKDMARDYPSLRTVVARLPRLATDQNPALPPGAQGYGICDVLLPIVRDVYDSSKENEMAKPG